MSTAYLPKNNRCFYVHCMFIRMAVTDLFVCCLCIETPASVYAIRFQEIEYRVIVSSYWAKTKVS